MARAEIFDPSEVAIVHVMARTCRRCFLLGEDAYSGKNFDHRKRWIEDKLKALAANFGIDLIAFSCLSNHFHLVLRSRPDVVETWDDTEVAHRWWLLCPTRKVKQTVDGCTVFVPATPTQYDLNSIRNDPVKLAVIRKRLSDISWWMRLLCQYIAMKANAEEGDGLGRFWQGRYKAVRILDEETLLACAAYVDLNPIRAALAETLEQSDYTSVQRRIAALRSAADASYVLESDYEDAFLTPVPIDEQKGEIGPCPSAGKKRCSDKGFLAMSTASYLEILDWLARTQVAGKRGSTSEAAPTIFERLNIDAVEWADMVMNFGKSFKNVAGKPKSIEAARSLKTHRKFYRTRV